MKFRPRKPKLPIESHHNRSKGYTRWIKGKLYCCDSSKGCHRCEH